jgi:hypothetical protein
VTGEERPDQTGDLIGLLVGSKVPGVKDVNLGVWQVATVGFVAGSGAAASCWHQPERRQL